MTLEQLAVKHPYYCSSSNYYSNDAGKSWDTATDFLNEYEDADIDMNLVFRFDIRQDEDDEPGKYNAEIFMIHQRKGLFAPHTIENVAEEEVERLSKFLEKHWQYMKQLWAPFSASDVCR